MTIQQERLELANLIERSQGLICMVRNGRVIHLKASQINLIISTLRQTQEIIDDSERGVD